MNLPLKKSLLVTTFVALSPIAMAAQSIDKRIDVDDTLKLNLQVHRGEVTIKPWDNAEIQITGTLDELSEGLLLEKQGSSVTIEDKMPRQYSGNNKDGSKLTIMVPKSLKLNADSVSASYTVNGLNGDISIQSVSGDIKATQLQQDITLITVSGDIVTAQLDGKTRLETVSGNINDQQSLGKVSYKLVSGDLSANSQASEASIETVSGSASVQFVEVNRFNGQSVSGDLILSFNRLSSKANIDSVSGDISLTLPNDMDARFTVNGGPGGDIDNSLTQDKPQKSKYTASRSLDFQMGNGSADIALGTISGTISLKQN
ncbi:DUF4097 family beta strand repeat-containing protein [Shewanella colwelliana]|uniref:DUF4097 domain-containing protein n=1 Tax=Shewanella colwelliana TaxID=23 RepID=A0A1E5IV52_SHECO|nr:DUF4097 family beta strand repeat-containing protein [Shewanella colwelliana]MCZ4339236.1 DUF4097 family beta strand repeat-containing protein [Shewanella colwelliana]OEG74404.1 hypothetical protein BEL05_06060 [Shewanella colwelliana]